MRLCPVEAWPASFAPEILCARPCRLSHGTGNGPRTHGNLARNLPNTPKHRRTEQASWGRSRSVRRPRQELQLLRFNHHIVRDAIFIDEQHHGLVACLIQGLPVFAEVRYGLMIDFLDDVATLYTGSGCCTGRRGTSPARSPATRSLRNSEAWRGRRWRRRGPSPGPSFPPDPRRAGWR